MILELVISFFTHNTSMILKISHLCEAWAEKSCVKNGSAEDVCIQMHFQMIFFNEILN